MITSDGAVLLHFRHNFFLQQTPALLQFRIYRRYLATAPKGSSQTHQVPNAPPPKSSTEAPFVADLGCVSQQTLLRFCSRHSSSPLLALRLVGHRLKAASCRALLLSAKKQLKTQEQEEGIEALVKNSERHKTVQGR